MSVSKERLAEFANFVLKHEAFEAISERMDADFLTRFRRGSDEERKVIADLMNGRDLFLTELKKVIAEMQELNDGQQPDSSSERTD